ncbi:hypothetical protein C1J03_22620 [Sulfitobacter sp. SK012]|uniref:HEPN-associated N-terminal domain-containing protein n=1 Tax=Sulfitobacter sp. SK012 TaxID=1389005 RepID=UPI000E0C8085|nr:HEPN-associated N-terminal domain-containing protein [Sulfitobacter sp. SK012]AXI48541.1 hypothetical protein C1J03_22620 [Sulfitobacter sp. SK012]
MAETPGECSYCEEEREHVAPFDNIAEFIGERMGAFYGRAVDQLPYITREGGYQGRHEDTYDCLLGSIGIAINSKRPKLLTDDLVSNIRDDAWCDAWCDYDWLSLDIDQSLQSSWKQFCHVTKGQRRFFFHHIGEPETSHPDERSIFGFLNELATLIEARGLIQTLPKGTSFYRARQNKNSDGWSAALELGPPPVEVSLQSNRMNPPGIPMFYGADTTDLAVAETRQIDVTVGRFETNRLIRVVDLANLPPVPGFFSEATREHLQTLEFLHSLSETMAEPVAQNNSVNVDYIPTQILTEFLRDYDFADGPIDGISYVTALGLQSFNTVLFATRENVTDDIDLSVGESRWLVLTDTEVCSG